MHTMALSYLETSIQINKSKIIFYNKNKQTCNCLDKIIFNVSFDFHFNWKIVYNKTCVKWPLKNRKKEILMTTGSSMKVESIAECSLGAFCNTFDLH